VKRGGGGPYFPSGGPTAVVGRRAGAGLPCGGGQAADFLLDNLELIGNGYRVGKFSPETKRRGQGTAGPASVLGLAAEAESNSERLAKRRGQ
jgi:hypothetical protein